MPCSDPAPFAAITTRAGVADVGRPETTRHRRNWLATLGQIVKGVLELYGLDAQALLAEQGITAEQIRDPNARIPSDKWDAVVRRAAKLIPHPGYALRAARCWHPSNLGALGFAWLSSATLRTGLQRVVRYWHLLSETSAGHLEDTHDGLKTVLDSGRPDPVVAAIWADFAMAMLVSMCRMNYGDALRPVQISLRRARPDGWQLYRAHYGCPVRFDAAEDSFTLTRGDADKPLPTSNRQIAATLDHILTRQLAQLDKSDIVAHCRASLLEQLSSGNPSGEEMAQQLNMSRRTLQRKLAEAETTYQELLDSTRRDLSLRYIDDPYRSVTDIAFMLGFSQQSAFTRAFRRWTGVSPSEYRQRNLAATS